MDNLNDKLEIESNKVLDEGMHYSAASKEYSESIRNLSTLENIRLAREKNENEQRRFEAQTELDRMKTENEKLRLENERLKLNEQIRSDRIKAENEHEERMAKIKVEIFGLAIDGLKVVGSSAVTLISVWTILNFEQVSNLTSKATMFIPKPKIG